MKAILFLLFITLALPSCQEEKKDVEVFDEKPQEDLSKLPLDEYAKRHVESSLSILATEKYTLEIIKGNLDGDGKEDEHEGSGQDGGRELFAQTGPHLTRQRGLFWATQKEHHHDFVKRGGKSKQGTG